MKFFARPHPGPPPEPVEDEIWERCQHRHRLRAIYDDRRDGVRLYGYQCLECGEKLFNSMMGLRASIDAGRDPNEHVPFDRQLRDRIWQAKRDEYQRRRDERDDAWRQWYSSYLQSTAWHDLRQKVLTRDNRTCRNIHCDRPAEQVHHVTYERVGCEDLDDLVSICRACHAMAHYRRETVR